MSLNAPVALVVDDEADILELIELTLVPLGIHCLLATTVAEAKALLRGQAVDFCLTDLRLPDGSGLELLAYLQKHHSAVPVAMITAHGNVESAVEALKLGAFDFVAKPFDINTLRRLAQSAIHSQGASDDLNTPASAPLLVGQSAAMERVRTRIRKLAKSLAPVLISGESGTGKELAARAIHALSARANQPFIAVNCGAIPDQLLESEFFGYKKGSFTGATQDKPGLFQAAHGGTLFLDEVADLPLAMQVKLLRVIQERAVRPLGAPTELVVDVRILSATHKNLAEAVHQGRFRQDLYYRLNVIDIVMPSLRERREDLDALCAHLLTRIAARTGGPQRQLSDAARQLLTQYDFPGNIRELENMLERAAALGDGPVIEGEEVQLPRDTDQKGQFLPPTGQSLPPTVSPTPSAAVPSVPAPLEVGLEDYLETLEKAAITQALQATRYNKTAAAERLGITFRALRYRLKKLGLE